MTLFTSVVLFENHISASDGIFGNDRDEAWRRPVAYLLQGHKFLSKSQGDRKQPLAVTLAVSC
jgi:hypothetical protein